MLKSEDKVEIEVNQYKNEENQQIKEKVKITNRTYTMRKQAEERRSWAKFADVSGVPRGTHRKGDYIVGMEVKIETEEGAQTGEIDIVKKFSQINTETIKMKKQKEKLAALNNLDDDVDLDELAKQTEELKGKKGKLRTNKLEDFQKMQEDCSVQLRNLGFLQFANNDEEADKIRDEFIEFLSQYIKKPGKSMGGWNLRLVRERYRNQNGFSPLRDMAFLSFSDDAKAEHAIDQLDGLMYQFCCINAQMAQRR